MASLPDGTTLLALGPLTNVAAALARAPSLAGRIRVAVVGGNRSSWGRWPPWWPFEFNLAKDAPAARALFKSDVARDVYPLDVCRRLTVGAVELRRLGRESLLGAWLAAGSWRWLLRAPLRYQRLRFPLWDLVPALDALGLLPSEHQQRRLCCVGRGRLVDEPTATPARVLTSLEEGPALAAFRRLLA
jgi:purine nucleosidase